MRVSVCLIYCRRRRRVLHVFSRRLHTDGDEEEGRDDDENRDPRYNYNYEYY